MLYRFRYHLTLLSFTLVLYWLILPFFKTNDEVYTLRDFDEDMNMFYCRMGSSSQMRGDFVKAVKFYEDALRYRPDDSECLKNLNLCIKKMKKGFKHLA